MNRQNFKDWFESILDGLYSNGNAGFAILMITFPLLERYLREKSGTEEEIFLKPSFFHEFRKIFPEIPDDASAQNFWQAYRHGLLHQGAFSLKSRKGILPSSWLSNNLSTIEIDKSGNFCVHPAGFAERVVATIEGDFETFEGRHSTSHPLSTVFNIGPTICGTAAPGSSFEGWPDPKKK